MKGVDLPRDAAIASLPPNMPRSSAQYAVIGFSPTSRMITPPTANASRIAQIGTRIGWMSK